MPVIAVASEAEPGIERPSAAAGAAGLLVAPLDSDAPVDKLRRWARRKRRSSNCPTAEVAR